MRFKTEFEVQYLGRDLKWKTFCKARDEKDANRRLFLFKDRHPLVTARVACRIVSGWMDPEQCVQDLQLIKNERGMP